MIHSVRATSDTNPSGSPNSGTDLWSISFRTISINHQFKSKWKYQTRGPMNRFAHASGFVRITHSLQRVVCTLSLGSKSRTTVPRVGETELITTSHVAFHTRLTHFPYHILIVSISYTNSSPRFPE